MYVAFPEHIYTDRLCKIRRLLLLPAFAVRQPTAYKTVVVKESLNVEQSKDLLCYHSGRIVNVQRSLRTIRFVFDPTGKTYNINLRPLRNCSTVWPADLHFMRFLWVKEEQNRTKRILHTDEHSSITITDTWQQATIMTFCSALGLLSPVNNGNYTGHLGQSFIASLVV